MELREYEIMSQLERNYWWYQSLQDRVLAMVRDLPPGLVVDVGAGTGGFAERLHATGRAVVGVDYSGTALSLWRDARRHAVQGDANRLPLGDACCAVVVSLDLICQADIEPARLLAEVRRVLRPSGWFLMTAPAYRWLRSGHDRAVHASRRFTRPELVEQLRRHGFIPRRATHLFPSFFPAIVAARGWRALVRPNDDLSDLHPLPTWLNRTLEAVGSLENTVGRHLDYAWGSTILIAAQRRDFA